MNILKIILYSLLFTASTMADKAENDLKAVKSVVFEKQSENKFSTKVLIRDCGLILDLPKKWSLESSKLILEQDNIDKVIADFKERFPMFKGKDHLFKEFKPNKEKPLCRIFTIQKTESFNSGLEPKFDDIALILADIKVFKNSNANNQSNKNYAEVKSLMKDDLESTISSKIHNLRINGMKAFYFRKYKIKTYHHYWIQADEDVLFFQVASDAEATKEMNSELERIIQRISKSK